MTQPLRFGRFRFEPQTARLWQADREVKLTRKAAAVLTVLVARAGHPVSKDELFATVWSNTVVGDDALVTCIQELRKALGDDARKPQYIETRHRSGYLFIAPTSPTSPDSPATTTSGGSLGGAPHGARTDVSEASRSATSSGARASANAASLEHTPHGARIQASEASTRAISFGARDDVPPSLSNEFAPQPPLPLAILDPSAIAVLPFADMSSARDQDFFCEGLAEELIDALTQIDGLRVAARSSSFQFRTPGLDIREVGRHLGVGSLVEGSVRKAGNLLRITVQLIDVTTGYHKWSQRFERELGDIFAIQDEIAESVATTLRGGALSTRERRAVRRQPTGTEPYECFLRGRQHMHRMQQPDMDQSRRMFERAIELDAGYAPAWAGLATLAALIYEWWGAREEDLKQADDASAKAMTLAPDLADAQVARGMALSLYRRYDEAQAHYEEAIRINPHLFDAYYYYARAAFSRGEIEHSADLFRKAGEARQEDFQSLNLLAQSLRMLGRHEEAQRAVRECIVRVERVLALNPRDGRALSLGASALLEEGHTERALEWSKRSLELYPDDMSAVLNAACLHSKLGHKEECLAYVEKAFSRGWGKKDWIEQDPDYDILRDDPRFIALLAKLR